MSDQRPDEVDCHDLGRLKRLGSHDLILVKQPKLMRGVDYRVTTGTMGISLLIMSDFANRRAYVQALGRVGRFNEKCKRFVWDQLGSPVNSLTEVAHMAALREMQVTKVVKPVKQQSTAKRSGKNGPAPAWQRSAADLFRMQIVSANEEAKEPRREESGEV